MSISRFFAALALTMAVSAALFAQAVHSNALAAAGGSGETRLEHFDPDLADKTLDPCDDFYKYSCNKWLTANPIPSDQVFWSTGSGLQLWNEGALRDTLEAASKNDEGRTPVQQKIGDYWAACMDEAGIESAGLKPIQPELARIAALKSKKDMTLEIAHLHHLYPAAWQGGDNQSNSPLFGFTGQQDFDNASLMVGAIDQAGLSLPNRDYYLNTDDKSKELLAEVPHAHPEDVRSRRRIRVPGCGRRGHRHRTRNGDGQGANGQRHAPRSQEHQQQDDSRAGPRPYAFH